MMRPQRHRQTPSDAVFLLAFLVLVTCKIVSRVKDEDDAFEGLPSSPPEPPEAP